MGVRVPYGGHELGKSQGGLRDGDVTTQHHAGVTSSKTKIGGGPRQGRDVRSVGDNHNLPETWKELKAYPV